MSIMYKYGYFGNSAPVNPSPGSFYIYNRIHALANLRQKHSFILKNLAPPLFLYKIFSFLLVPITPSGSSRAGISLLQQAPAQALLLAKNFKLYQ
ncbi:hypothetical protein D770_08645 [Flammeovirgaceae bacterium 311]|nr:hypothetical protein D770_08645 [Flammeovirgaceae bacterium 311]